MHSTSQSFPHSPCLHPKLPINWVLLESFMCRGKRIWYEEFIQRCEWLHVSHQVAAEFLSTGRQSKAVSLNPPGSG